MFPLLIPLLLGGGAVLVATQVARGGKRGEGVPPAVTRADPFEGYDQWNATGSEPIRQSSYHAVVVRRGDERAPVTPVRAAPRWEPDDDDEAERLEPVPATRTRRQRDPGPRRPRQVGPPAPAPRRALPPEREVNALPDDLVDEDGLSEDFNEQWSRVQAQRGP